MELLNEPTNHHVAVAGFLYAMRVYSRRWGGHTYQQRARPVCVSPLSQIQTGTVRSQTSAPIQKSRPLKFALAPCPNHVIRWRRHIIVMDVVQL